MSDFYELADAYEMKRRDAEALRDYRIAQDRAERRQSLLATVWIGLACLALIGGAAVLLEIAR